MARRPPAPELRLIASGVVFPVKKALLMEKLSFFQEDCARLNAAEYRVRSPATPEAFTAFVKFLEGEPLAVGAGNAASLRALSAEFGCAALCEQCDAFEKSRVGGSSDAADAADAAVEGRLWALEERQGALERLTAQEAAERRSLREAVQALEAEVERLSRLCSGMEGSISEQTGVFEAEQAYRRGCECLFGANGFGEQGRLVSEGLGLSLLKASADAGHADAQFRVGDCLLVGRGCAVDRPAAREYLRRSAEAGNSFAEFQYGLCLAQGCGGAKDAALGVEFLRRSAEGGNARGQVGLAFAYADGHGVAEDPAQAVEYLRRAADQGNSMGRVNYGVSLVGGIGCQADPAAGASLMRQAANQGNVIAQFNYALYLECGTGVAQDLALAVHFYTLAMDGGHTNAKAEYERLRGSVPLS